MRVSGVCTAAGGSASRQGAAVAHHLRLRQRVPPPAPPWCSDLGVELFRDALLSRRELLDKLVSSMLGLITADRQGQLVDR